MIAHIGFTGTRHGLTEAQRTTLRLLLTLGSPRRCIGPADEAWAHHGDCIEADADFHALAREAGFLIHLHPPAEPGQRAFCEIGSHGISEQVLPYMQRNDAIIAACTLLLACPSGFESEIRSGTWATIRHAGKAGRTTLIVWPDGDVEVRPGTPAGVQPRRA